MNATVMETASLKPRRPWLAGVLSLFGGPLGQIYVGRLRRSLFLWLVYGCLLPILAFCTIGAPLGRFGFVLFLLLFLCMAAFQVFVVADAVLLARRNRRALLKRYQRWWFYLLLFLLFCLANNGVVYFIRSFIAEAFVMPTTGMSPTIQPGDRILADKLWFNRKHLHRHDVVVFHRGPDSATYMRRVAGLPGDEIEIKNERVFVNGAEWDDPHAVFNASLPIFDQVANHGPVKVPSDCCFLLGDNRRISKDSRSTGPTLLSDLYGVARFIYWSRERTLPNPNDSTHYESGPIHWERLGVRLD